VPLPSETEVVAFVRDDDPRGSKGEAAGYGAYVRLLRQASAVSLTPAPSAVAGEGAPRLKDINDLQRYDSALVSQLLNSTAAPPSSFAETTYDAIVDAMSRFEALPLFVLHDFDVAGFSIRKTLVEDTDRYQFKH
jgi:hypothetical protein